MLNSITPLHLLFFFISFIFPTQNFQENKNFSNRDFIVLTIPKSGTGLIIKTISIMLHLDPADMPLDGSVEELEKSLDDRHFYAQHFPLNPLHEKYAFQKKAICMIRDPRDILISLVHHVTQKGWPGMSKNTDYHNWFNTLSFNNKLSYILKHDIKDSPLAFYKSTLSAINSIPKFNSLLIRFENLVGEKGGGTKEVQSKELDKIAQFLKIPLSESKKSDLIENSFGECETCKTFREGQIGAWKNLFTEEHKRLFKEKYNHILITLGYETSDLW